MLPSASVPLPLRVSDEVGKEIVWSEPAFATGDLFAMMEVVPPYSNAPMSGAEPLNSRLRTLMPAFIRLEPAARCRN